MNTTKISDGERFSGDEYEYEDQEEGDGDQEEGRAKLITPQIFPTTPLPLPPGPKTLREFEDDPLSITNSFRTKVDDQGNFSITIKKE